MTFHQYFKIRNFLKTNNGLRPSSLYSAAKFVDILRPGRLLQNCACSRLISGPSWIPHTSPAYPKPDPTRLSKS